MVSTAVFVARTVSLLAERGCMERDPSPSLGALEGSSPCGLRGRGPVRRPSVKFWMCVPPPPRRAPHREARLEAGAASAAVFTLLSGCQLGNQRQLEKLDWWTGRAPGRHLKALRSRLLSGKSCWALCSQEAAWTVDGAASPYLSPHWTGLSGFFREGH